MRAKEILKIAGAGLLSLVVGLPCAAVTLLCCVANVRGCVHSVWTAPKEPAFYTVAGSDTTFGLWLLPESKALIITGETDEQGVPSEAETVLLKILDAEPAKPAVGPIWFLGEEPWSMRIYPDGGKPWTFELRVLKKWRFGPGDSNYLPVGDSGKTRWFTRNGKDEIKVAGQWLTKREPGEKQRIAFDGAMQLLKEKP